MDSSGREYIKLGTTRKGKRGKGERSQTGTRKLECVPSAINYPTIANFRPLPDCRPLFPSFPDQFIKPDHGKITGQIQMENRESFAKWKINQSKRLEFVNTKNPLILTVGFDNSTTDCKWNGSCRKREVRLSPVKSWQTASPRHSGRTSTASSQSVTCLLNASRVDYFASKCRHIQTTTQMA